MSGPTLRTTLYRCCPGRLRPHWDRIEASDLGARLARGAFWSLTGALVSRGAMLVAFMLLARMLGKEGFGELGIIRSTVGMFGTLAGFGLGLTATKHVAEFRHSDPERAGRIVALSSLVALGTGCVMAVGLWAFAPWLADKTLQAPHLCGLLRVGALLLFLNALNGAQTGALAGFEAFKTIARVNLLVGLVAFPILVGGASLAGLSGAVWGLTLTFAVNWVLNHFALRRESRRAGVPVGLAGCTREWPVLWQFSLPAAIGPTMVAPVTWIARAMLVNQPGGYAELGLFEAADQWRMLVLYPSTLIAGSCLPVLAQLYADGQRGRFKKTLSAEFFVTAAMTSIFAALVALLAGPILACYGRGFAGHVSVVVVIMLATVLAQLVRVGGLVNQSAGTVWWGVLLNLIWAAIFLTAARWLVGRGALGLASATLISYACHLAVVMLYVSHLFRTSAKLNAEGAT